MTTARRFGSQARRRCGPRDDRRRPTGDAAVGDDRPIGDRIIDTSAQRNMKPLVQIGFMPEALSTPPQQLLREFLEHCARRAARA